MSNENYTSTQLKEKIKEYNIKAYASLIPVIGGAILFNLSFYSYFDRRLDAPWRVSPRPPEIVQKYNYAKETLEILESQTFPYENREIQIILGKDPIQVSKLEKAIEKVKKDMLEIKKIPEYTEYISKEKHRDNLGIGGIFVGLAVSFLSGVGLIGKFLHKRDKLKEELKNISK